MASTQTVSHGTSIAAAVCIGLTAVCLIAFWVTIPLPRIDGQLVGSDGVFYYIYLPSFWLDRGLDLSNAYDYYFPNYAGRSEFASANKFGIGTAIFWSPFFLVAHGVALTLRSLGLAIPTTGYSYLYQAVTLSGSIIYGGIALWLTYRFVASVISKEPALIAAVLVVFGGNLVYYMTAEPSMSHTVSAFLSSLFFLVWHRRANQENVVSAAIYGLVAGLMALVRPQDGVFLALPFVARLPAVISSLREPRDTRIWTCWLRDGAIAVIVAGLVFAPQMLVWQHFYGHPLTSGYQIGGEGFNWLSPRMGAVLFSSYRGLITWHPVFGLALAGLWLGRRRDPMLVGIAFLSFLAQWYLIASWSSWMQGDAFGGRMFIVCTPGFALGLGYLIEWLVKKTALSVVRLVGGLLLAWNLLLFIEYRFDLVLWPAPPTWYDLTIRRVTFLLEWLVPGRH
jgi:hypothetical protein